jgi:hypothetical protein
MLYDVNLVVVVRVKIGGVDASSEQEAVKKAELGVDWNKLLGQEGVVQRFYTEDVTALSKDAEKLMSGRY